MKDFIRKVISAIDTDGCSRFLEDTQVPVTLTDEKYPGFAVTELFYTEQNPQNLSVNHTSRPYDLALPSGAFRVCICRIPPLAELITYARKNNLPIPDNEKDYMMHKTLSVDYAYILSGEIVLRLDNGEEKLLKPGDLVVQKGAMHTWNNFTTEPCDLLGIMIGADSFDL